jgi:hypothetical protein
MNIHNINRRLDQLDARTPAEPRRVVLVVREEDETQAEAIARWCVEHPDEDPPDDAVDFIILNSIVSPNAKRE